MTIWNNSDTGDRRKYDVWRRRWIAWPETATLTHPPGKSVANEWVEVCTTSECPLSWHQYWCRLPVVDGDGEDQPEGKKVRTEPREHLPPPSAVEAVARSISAIPTPTLVVFAVFVFFVAGAIIVRL